MIRKRVPDKFKARSMLQAAEIEIKFIKTLKPSQESAATIVRSVYEVFRMLGNALLLMRGKEATGIDHHTEMIKELFTLKADTARPIQILLNLKSLRNRINYQGYIPAGEEAEDALAIVESCFDPILDEIKKELNRI